MTNVRVFIAGLATETNTFSPIPTGRQSFFGDRFARRDGSLEPATWGNVAQREWRKLAEASGFDVVESISASAQPGGLTTRGVYEELRDMVLKDLRATPRPDVVLLNMHGAMVADGYDDCEGDLLAHVRAIVGPETVVAGELDLHCHLTEQMRTEADILVLYKEHPHDDIADRAREVFDLAVRAARHEISPIMYLHDLRMSSRWRTPVQPARTLVDEMKEAEQKGGLLSVSFAHGFAWADVPDVGSKVLAIADGDVSVARAAAERFGNRIWELRHQSGPRRLDVAECIDAILGAPEGRLLVVADTTDNAGGGSPSDATHFLRRCLEREVRDVALGAFWDPVAVTLCEEAGVGARLPLRIGGKVSRTGGLPVDLDVVVRELSPRHVQTALSGAQATMGRAAWVQAGGLHLLLNTNRQQVFHPDAFENIGCRLDGLRAVVVKSSQHFYTGFAPIAGEVIYGTSPGTMHADLATLPYTRRRHPYWPRVEDPFAT